MKMRGKRLFLRCLLSVREALSLIQSTKLVFEAILFLLDSEPMGERSAVKVFWYK